MSDQGSRAAGRKDIYSEITSQLIAAIESGPGKLALPWRRSGGGLFMPVNALTRNAYNGINVVSLWVAAEVKSYATPVWATYKQWLEVGAQVRKDEKSSVVSSTRSSTRTPIPTMPAMTANAVSRAHRGSPMPNRWMAMPRLRKLSSSDPSSALQRQTGL